MNDDAVEKRQDFDRAAACRRRVDELMTELRKTAIKTINCKLIASTFRESGEK